MIYIGASIAGVLFTTYEGPQSKKERLMYVLVCIGLLTIGNLITTEKEGKSVNMYDMSDKDFEKEYGLTEGRRVVGGTAILSLFIYIGIVYPLLKRNVKGE